MWAGAIPRKARLKCIRAVRVGPPAEGSAGLQPVWGPGWAWSVVQQMCSAVVKVAASWVRGECPVVILACVEYELVSMEVPTDIM